MPKKGIKRALSAITKAALKVKKARTREGSNERTKRLDAQKQYNTEKRKNESPEEKAQRQKEIRERNAYVRSAESVEGSERRNRRLDAQKEYESKKRKNETPEEKSKRQKQIRDINTEVRSIESPVKKALRLFRQRIQQRKYDVKKFQDALQTEKKLGCAKDIDFFQEKEFPEKLKKHKLPSLYEANNVCPHCSAYRWHEERDGFCCENGRVVLPPVKVQPEELRDLFQNKEFVDNIRSYNNALTLASIGCNEQHVPGWNPTFKIQGKVFHRIGSLKPNDGESPKFAQIYFYDSDNEVKNRLKHNPRLEEAILLKVQECLKKVNPYIQSLQYATEICEENPEVKVVIHADKTPKGEHPRRYNLPQNSEIAVIMPGEQEDPLDVVIQHKSGNLETINSLHRSYDPLHYILLFPGGDDGYTTSIKKEKKKEKNGKEENGKEEKEKHISPVEFYKYRLQVRKDDENTVMKGRKLTQQYATDAYVKAEHERLCWIKNHQKEIRAEKYQCLLDAVNENDGPNAGRKVILPPTFTESPRWYCETFQNSMALVRKYGKPDYFLTFTCNPQWPEITSSLLPGESPHDRPDICDRVFKIKHKVLLDDLFKHQVLGKVNALTSMIEFQKRGLPHAHILLIMSDEDKPRTPEDINRVVSAEIPDVTVNPDLHAIITKHMVHGPCGPINENSPCMETTSDGKVCGKDFPKEFQEHTVINANGYPLYRRRSPENGGNTHNTSVKGQDFTIDNRWVVPYSPLLSLKYNAHLNVEVVNSVKAVKYLYKYITKGSDRVIIHLANGETKDITNDEPERFENARYVPASKAYWRLFEFRMAEMYPPVAKLPLHLENEQFVYFQPEEASSIAKKPPPKTKLMAYFDLNKQSDEAIDILYPDICQFYTWEGNRWKRRKNKISKLNKEGPAYSDVIGRIPVVGLNGNQTELYYLRMMLYHKAGAKSFTDLRTINGEVQPSFQAACLKMGLLDDDTENDRTMEEAASIRFGPQLRETFAMILIWNRPVDTKAFWEKHKAVLCEDLMRHDGKTEPSAEILNEALIDIEDHLQRNGFELETFQLPKPDHDLVSNRIPREIREESEYNIEVLRQIAEQNIPLLNEDQRKVYDTVIESVNMRKGEIIALDAAGGSGKTFLTTTIVASLRAQQKVALETATSGLAATLLLNGRTLHSRCKVPVEGLNEHSFCNISKREALADLIRKADFLVVDEVTMARKEVYEAVDRSFQDIRGNNLPFGGITVLLSGDWRQILPVVRHGGRADIVAACLKKSYLWKKVKVLKLTKNMRLNQEDASSEKFAEDLLLIGEGKVPIEEDLGEFKIKVDDDFLLEEDSQEALCNFVWDGLQAHYQEPEWLCSRAVLCPTNEAADEINQHMTDRFPGIERYYLSSDQLIDGDKTQFPQEFLNTLTSSGMPPHKLSLKEGCPVMLMRNLDPSKGHCNGTRYVVTGLYDHVIDVAVATGVHVGRRMMIPRIPTCPTESIFPFRMQRRQFPLRTCFAMTANKSQGQGLKRIGIYLKKQFFSHGQLYVALSRVSSKKNIKILAKQGRFQGKDGLYIDNVVYPEILS